MYMARRGDIKLSTDNERLNKTKEGGLKGCSNRSQGRGLG
jgi:hypothetical protein